jgi:hypothetical protein
MVGHAEGLGMLPRPKRGGRYRHWQPRHVDALREYLRNHSRGQRSSLLLETEGGGK